MPSTTMSDQELIEAAEKLVPLFRAKAREAELARRAPDENWGGHGHRLKRKEAGRNQLGDTS